MRQKKESSDDMTLLSELIEAEKSHAQRMKELVVMKRRGDWGLVADELGISRENAIMAFRRIHSQRHNDVVNKLEEIIESRIKKMKS